MTRLDDLKRFYNLLDRAERAVGGARPLRELLNGTELPRRGVYFFFEPGEDRSDTGIGPRVVRVGTHGLTVGSRSTFRQRLAQHRGTAVGGNHRGSIFRLLVGQSLSARGDVARSPSWGIKSDAKKAAATLGIDVQSLANSERPIEKAVSDYLATMVCAFVGINDDPGPSSERGFVERNTISLLSNQNKTAIDAPSASWLGTYSDREPVRSSGLWNQRHVNENYDPSFLDRFEQMIAGVENIR